MKCFAWQGNTLPVLSLIGNNATDRPQQSPKRVLADFVCYLVTEGELFLSENSQKLHLSRGDCLFLEPQLLQYGLQPSHYHILYAHFSLSGLQTLPEIPSSQEGSELLLLPKKLSLGNSPAFHRLKGLLEQAVEEKNAPLSCACRFLLFLSELSREAALLRSGTPLQGDRGKALAGEVVSYLRENYHRRLTGDLLAKELSYHFDYLNQLVRLHFSTTVFRMLTDLRMENAVNLLLNSNCSVKEIAEETGYRDESYFTKVFKKRNGIPPLQFRKRAREALSAGADHRSFPFGNGQSDLSGPPPLSGKPL